MKMKKQYNTPELEKFGTITDLSAGGSGGAPESMDSGNTGAEFQRP